MNREIVFAVKKKHLDLEKGKQSTTIELEQITKLATCGLVVKVKTGNPPATSAELGIGLDWDDQVTFTISKIARQATLETKQKKAATTGGKTLSEDVKNERKRRGRKKDVPTG